MRIPSSSSVAVGTYPASRGAANACVQRSAQMLGCAALMTACHIANGTPISINCPARIPVQAGALAANAPAPTTAPQASAAAADPSAGLTLFVPESVVHLSGASVFSGPPQEGAVLMPAKDNDREATWLLQLPAGLKAWVSCDYAKGLVRMVREVPESTRRCTARTTRMPPPKGTAITFTCE